jgi:hypothetical protein
MGAKHKINTTPTAAVVDYPEFRPQGALNIVQAALYCGVRCSAIEDAVRDGSSLAAASAGTSSSLNRIWTRFSDLWTFYRLTRHRPS